MDAIQPVAAKFHQDRATLVLVSASSTPDPERTYCCRLVQHYTSPFSPESRNLSIYVDSDVSMRTHVVNTVSSCFAILRCIRSIRRSVSSSVLKSLVVSLVLPRMDYVLAGLQLQLLDRLQYVMSAAARLVFSPEIYDHITPLLRDFHWLRSAHSTTD